MRERCCRSRALSSQGAPPECWDAGPDASWARGRGVCGACAGPRLRRRRPMGAGEHVQRGHHSPADAVLGHPHRHQPPAGIPGTASAPAGSHTGSPQVRKVQLPSSGIVFNWGGDWRSLKCIRPDYSEQSEIEGKQGHSRCSTSRVTAPACVAGRAAACSTSCSYPRFLWHSPSLRWKDGGTQCVSWVMHRSTAAQEAAAAADFACCGPG